MDEEKTAYKKIPAETADFFAENRKKLEELFPSVFKDGELDIDALHEELGDFEENKTEHYELSWAGKHKAKKSAGEILYGRTLKYFPDESKNPDTTENLYIEGDNLEVLKLLQNSYINKIKMIYIDPPYNTGNDFVYNDSFKMSELETKVAQGDAELKVPSEGGVSLERFILNSNTSGRYHANWLSMMYPRLKLAKNLLTDDGVIFISIDDHEQASLKLMCDEIFGGNNFICNFVRKNKAGSGHDSKKIAIEFDYVLCYCKNYDFQNINQEFVDIENDGKYKLEDEFVKERGKYYLRDLDYKGSYSEKLDYPINTPDGQKIWSGGQFGKPNTWRWGKEKLEWGINNGFIVFKNKNGKWKVYIKQYQFVDNEGNYYVRTVPYRALIDYSNGAGTTDLSAVLETNVFSYPKPIGLLKHFINIACKNNSLILDFFSGSATTAHAVMQLNSEDGGNRKFIMIQLPEPTDEKSEAYKAGYKNICEIGKERIRRAGDKIKSENPDAQIDIGFKVFKTSDTNIRWTAAESGIKAGGKEVTLDDIITTGNKDLRDFLDNTKDIDVVYEILLKQYDIPLSAEIKKLSEIGKRTYIIADVLIVCLETEITDEIIDKIAEREPTPHKIIFRDSAFNDNISLKENAMMRFDALMQMHSEGGKQPYTVEFL